MRTENGGDGSLAAQNTTTTILLAGGVIDESNRGERYGKRQPALSWWSCRVVGCICCREKTAKEGNPLQYVCGQDVDRFLKLGNFASTT